MTITVDGIIECLQRKVIFEERDCFKKFYIESACNYAKFIRLFPDSDIVICNCDKGRQSPFPIPSLKDNSICIATSFNLKSNHVIPYTKISKERMYECRNRRTMEKLMEKFHTFIDYKNYINSLKK